MRLVLSIITLLIFSFAHGEEGKTITGDTAVAMKGYMKSNGDPKAGKLWNFDCQPKGCKFGQSKTEDETFSERFRDILQANGFTKRKTVGYFYCFRSSDKCFIHKYEETNKIDTPKATAKVD